MISSDNFYCFLQFEGVHVPQCPIAGDATVMHHAVVKRQHIVMNNDGGVSQPVTKNKK
jgi:hypothetical protein